MQAAASTIIELVMQHARQKPRSEAFILLDDGEQESGRRTFAELDAGARRTASWLAAQGLAGRNILLLLRDNRQFIDALLGCFYAGAIAIPTAVPRPGKTARFLLAIAANARPAAILVCRADMEDLRPAIQPGIPGVRWLAMEDIAGADAALPLPMPDQTAFIQYTSGSTGAPKGVLITHRNLMANEAAIQSAMDTSRHTVFAGWLPLFHDMGLIGNVLQPLYLGIPAILMPPVTFLQRPVRWLAAISKYRATVSGAPNFAYDLCVRRISDAQRQSLDLSCWRVAFNGSEPVSAETIDRFTEAFAPAGFARRSFYPCYGMAESTLMITGIGVDDIPTYARLPAKNANPDDDAGDSGQQAPTGKRLVSCGAAVSATELLIVDPVTSRRAGEGSIGEIWVRGSSVSPGYYNAPEATSAVFDGQLMPEAQGGWLRTGDLGFLLGGHLFVTGRIKDLIIVRGVNHYPQDLEETASASNPLLARGCAAAVMIDDNPRASVVIVQEVTREGWQRADPERVAADIREAIAEAHGLSVDVALIRPGSLPRTSSGKTRRTACGELIRQRALELLPARSRDHATVGESGS